MRTFTRATAILLAACVGSALAQAEPDEKKNKSKLELSAESVLEDLDQEVVRIQKLTKERARELELRAQTIAANAQEKAARALAMGDKARSAVLLRYKSEKEKAAYLGLSTSPVTGALREQLKLQKGVGLVVEHVDPESPAEKAGLKRYDIIQKLNDQVLINSHQLAVLVRTFKPGDEVDLQVLREGKNQSLPIRLTEKEVPVLDDRSPYASLVDVEFSPIMAPAAPPPPEGVVRPAVDPAGYSVRTTGRMTLNAAQREVHMNDGEHSLTMIHKGGRRILRAEDKDGKVLYEGPIDNREQIPAEVMGKLRQLEMLEQQPVPADVPGIGSLFKSTTIANRALDFSDGKQTISIKVRDTPEGRRLTMKVRDETGRELIHAPIETADDRAKVPEEYRAKLQEPAVKQFLEEFDKGEWQEAVKPPGNVPRPSKLQRR